MLMTFLIHFHFQQKQALEMELLFECIDMCEY